jgi:hypothetical protein
MLYNVEKFDYEGFRGWAHAAAIFSRKVGSSPANLPGRTVTAMNKSSGESGSYKRKRRVSVTRKNKRSCNRRTS